MTKQFETAERLQSQFRFYFVSLVFTLLAASIQTAKFGDSQIQTILELFGWLCFSVSGLVALSYLEWEPLIREQLATRDSFSTQIIEAQKAKLQGVNQVHVLTSGKPQTIDERIANLEESARRLTAAADQRLSTAGIKYEIWRWSFLAALISMVIARGGSALVHVFGYKLI